MKTLVSERKWWILAMAAAALILLTVAAYVIVRVYDGPAPDDSTMNPAWPAATPANQPLSDFLDAARQSDVIGTESQADDNPLAGIDPPSPVFAALDKLLATDPHTWAWPDGSKQEKILQADLDALDCLEAVKMILMRRARHLSDAGSAGGAVQDCLRLIRLGHGLAQTHTTGMRLTTAVKFQQYGMATLEHFITASTITPENIRQILTELLTLEGPSRENCQFTLRVQYQNLKHLLRDEATQQAVLKELDRSPPWRDEIKVHQTQATWLSRNGAVYDALAIDWHATATALRTADLASTKRIAWDRQLVTLQRNRAGRLYVIMMSPLSTMRQIIQFKTVHSQAVLMLALRLYELEKGHLPDSLAQLTPEFLQHIPLDIPTTQPLHWNAATHLLYSVGPDGTDNTGSASVHGDILSTTKVKPGETSDDLGQYYWWSDEARDHRAISNQKISGHTRP